MLHKPTALELQNAKNKCIPDVIAHDLDVLFCGINPGLYSGATGVHFARPGNRFWLTLYHAGFTPRQLNPSEQHELLTHKCGITNLVSRTTATAAELTPDELSAGVAALTQKIKRFTPRILAVLGISAYRIGFHMPKAQLGLQMQHFPKTQTWVLPNPSGLNANYQLSDLVSLFKTLRKHI